METYCVSETCAVANSIYDPAGFHIVWRVLGPRNEIVVDDLKTRDEARQWADLLNAAYEAGRSVVK